VAGFVLARNEGSLLPLDADTVRKVAILGPNAALARALGGGSNRLPASCRLPTRRVAVPLGDEVEVVHAAGVRAGVGPISRDRDPDGLPAS
jgi:beta-glucosidase